MSFAAQLISLYTIVRKEVVRFFRIWGQTLLPPLINQSLYFIIFGGFIGSQVSNIQGIPYMAFLIPGLVMMAVINNSYANVVGSFFGNKFQRSIEELLVSPTPNWVIILGYAFGGALRGMVVGLLVFSLSIFFVSPQITHPGIVLLFMILTAVLFSLGGLLNGIFAKNFDEVAIFTTFVLTPLTYFGGVFYSTQALPEIWQTISKFNPILYMVDGFRYGFFGVSDLPLWQSLSVLFGLTLVLLFLNFYLLKRGVGLKS